MQTRTHIMIGTASVAVALLASACGGGGHLVRNPEPAAPPDPPPRPSFDPCPPPVTADCRVDLAPHRQETLPETDSNHALVLDGGGSLDLQGRYRFDGGTRIEYGILSVGSMETVLRSDVLVGERGELRVLGEVQGNVDNRGKVVLYGLVGGNLENSGRLEAFGAVYGNPMRIDGDFTQSADGTFAFALVALSDWESGLVVPLQVGGRANLDGILELGRYADAWGPYALPDPRAHHIIHAGGGVSGTFDGWTSPGLAITGTLRYEANDVWFDLERASVVDAIASRGIGSALSRRSAANLDRAFGAADAFAGRPEGSLSDVQRRFLRSASSVMWLQDPAQVERSLDSLAGHAHLGAPDALLRDAAEASARVDARLATADAGSGTSAWALSPRPGPAGQPIIGAPTTGVERWLSPRTLVGGGIVSGPASLGFDRLGGFARGDASRAGLYAHYRGDGWHATAAAGAGRARLELRRPIELGAAGRHVALSRREFGLAYLHAELARPLHAGGGRLTPYLAFDYARVHGDAFLEHGDTGFELAGMRSRQTRLGAAAGARYARVLGASGQGPWFELDARYRHDLVADDDVRAAFRGVPDAAFDLPGHRGRGAGELRLGLGGSAGSRSRWYLDYAATFGGEHRDQALEAGLLHAF